MNAIDDEANFLRGMVTQAQGSADILRMERDAARMKLAVVTSALVHCLTAYEHNQLADKNLWDAVAAVLKEIQA